ncbi:MAG: helix-hairpin-helix domain-containing protein [Thermomicrobiales bacterium]
MTNDEVASVLEQYGKLLEISGESAFRVRAYSRAADEIRHIREPLTFYAQERKLTDITGVGAGLAAAIEELLSTGQYRPFEDLKQTTPASLLEIVEIPGVGVKTVSKLYADLGITSLSELETALSSGAVAAQKGFGPKTAERIQAGIEQMKRRTGRFLLGTARPISLALERELKQANPTSRVSVAGSVRRMEETVGDVDLIVATEDFDSVEASARSLLQLSNVERDDPSNLRGRAPYGIGVHITLTKPSGFGATLLRATGNDQHLTLLGEIPDADSEEEIYASKGLPWIPPELRQGIDEFALAESGGLDSLVTVDAINGEFHSHSTWSDGSFSIADMAIAAKRRGYRFLAISDHSKSLGIANGLDRERINLQHSAIKAAQDATGIKLFASCEVEVDRSGNLDFEDDVLDGLDIVIASTHSGLRQSREHLTERLIRVLENQNVDIIAHPSGRLLEQREGGDFDWQQIFTLAAQTGTALEINADPARLDLGAELARRALAAGCLLTINCDAHHPESFANVEYGVAVARRAGATSDRILNCWPVADIERWLANRGKR